MRFNDKVAFITGGAIGFGRAFAGALCAEGASVALADIDLAAAQATAAALNAQGFRAIAVSCDVADEHSVDRAVATTVAELGGVDVLINNAGKHLTKYNQPFGTLTRAEIRGLFDVNVIGIVNCSLACKESMRMRGGGAILNISSIAGFATSSPYGVSKLAVRGLTIAFATEFAAEKIRVNAIAPGLMGTENALADLPQALVEEFTQKLQLVKRLGQMDDIVSAMLFLCSDEASFVTGETLKVSGGFPLSI
jgi:NAD(P)-dependent dehydrogenase (short-subunit alcohol dehydrogenase family)